MKRRIGKLIYQIFGSLSAFVFLASISGSVKFSASGYGINTQKTNLGHDDLNYKNIFEEFCVALRFKFHVP